VDLEFLRRAREKYRRIAFFNDNAGGGIPRFEVLPFVDLLLNKALFRDRSLYFRSFYGDELFTQYYHDRYGVTDDEPTSRVALTDRGDLEKIRLSWNIGVADLPVAVFRQRVAVALARTLRPGLAKLFYHRDFWKGSAPAGAPRDLPVHARLGMPPKKSVNYQRVLILEKIRGLPEFLVGRVSQDQYNAEILRSRIILSPFGWGELCKRDFEAVYNRSLMLKPDMSHLETWPDVFAPGETYVPFDWDASDLVAKARAYLADEPQRRRIADRAWQSYHDQLQGLDGRFEKVLEAVLG
jgi:hypothetical protein